MSAGSPQGIPFRYEIIKSYPQRGPLFQYRLAESTTFTCCRCSKDKKSKLVSLIHNQWGRLLCNGCYGLLLSVWNIKSGDLGDSDRLTELLRILKHLAPEDQVERARSTLLAKDSRAKLLSADSFTALATAEAVASGLTKESATDLDWSAAVIGLCKAVEIEVLRLVGLRVREAAVGVDLTSDIRDRDFGKIARFCRDGSPIELGSFVHFVRASMKANRSLTSPTVRAFRHVVRQWPKSDWLFLEEGFIGRVSNLTRNYRNPAAHTAILASDDYAQCSQDVQGDDGILWNLLAAVEPMRR